MKIIFDGDREVICLDDSESEMERVDREEEQREKEGRDKKKRNGGKQTARKKSKMFQLFSDFSSIKRDNKYNKSLGYRQRISSVQIV